MAFKFHSPCDGVNYVEIPVSGITSNVYVLGPPGEVLIIDTGGAGFAGEVIGTLEGQGCKPGAVRAIVITHGHADHYGGAAALAAWSGAPVWAHLAAAVQIEDHWGDYILPGGPAANVGPRDGEQFQKGAGDEVRVDRLLRDSDRLEHAGRTLEVLHTPGHQRGLITLFEPQRRLAFVGDLVQGGMDVSANWLGLFEDVAGQRRSLGRVAALDPAWLFKGHRMPRSGDDVQTDIASAVRRLDAIEAALVETLEERSCSVAQLVRAVFRRTLDMDVADVRNYAVVTVTAFLIDLAQHGRVERDSNLEWHLVR